jgi:acyl carrier protein
MTFTNDTTTGARDSSATELALRVLFGSRFVATLDPAFIDSLTVHSATWADAIRAIWELAGDHRTADGAAPGPRGPARASGHSAHRDEPPQRPGWLAAEPPVTPAVGAAAYLNGADGVTAQPAEEEDGDADGNVPASTVEVFDPARQQDPAAGLMRDQPWTYEEVRDEFVALLQEATGYPAEVLDENADLEADLAIDSVKQVEALGTLRQRYALTIDEDFAIRDYRTIFKAATYLTARLNSERVVPAVS